MKRTFLLPIALAAMAASAFAADQVANLRQGVDMTARITGGSYSYNAGFYGSGNGSLDPTFHERVNKPSGTLNGSARMEELFPQFGVNAQIVLTGERIDDNRADWAVSAPELIGQRVPITISGFQTEATVNSLTGTLKAVVFQAEEPLWDSKAGVARMLGMYSVNGGTSSTITITGTLHGPFGDQPFTLTMNPIGFSGLGGPTPVRFTNFTVEPSTVVGGRNITGSFTIDRPAPPGGVTVRVASGSAAITAPRSVDIPGGETSASFTLTTSEVGSMAVRSVTAKLFNITRSVSITLMPRLRVALTVAPPEVEGFDTATGTVTLSRAAPQGGVLVTLTSESSAIQVPNSVFVAAGQTQAVFEIQTQNVGSTVTRFIRATHDGETSVAPLTIHPVAAVHRLTADPMTVKGGEPVQVTVTLNRVAPAGGATVEISTNSAVLIVPQTVVVPAGQDSVTFTVQTQRVGFQATRHIFATRGQVTRSVAITLTP
jgi:hypothetical protein